MDEIKERWIVEWFPPTGDQKRSFTTEAAARAFAAKDGWSERDDVAQWFPMLTHRKTVTTVTETILELVP